MEIKLKPAIILGYFVLLIINVTEFRAGIWLSVLQLLLGILLFFPKLVKGLNWTRSTVYETSLKIAFLSALVAGISYKWYDAPNHMFLFFYLGLIVLFVKKEDDIRDNFRWMVVIIMGFAAFHKISNPNFISGDFLAYRLLSGDFFQPVYMSGLFPKIKDVLDQNYRAIYEFTQNETFLSGQITLNNVEPNLMAGLKFFVYMIIGMEFLLAVLFAFFINKRMALIVLLVFVASIGLIVSEFEFAATLLFMGCILCPATYGSLRPLFWTAFGLYAILALQNNIMLM